jgi:hypothetical protein
MVQVDVFWSYALGASFASAAARQLRKTDKPFESKYFSYTMVFLACIFGPSGIYLLWQFPHWETMQVASTWGDLPAWLVVVFSVTNITQGILGFFVSYLFIRKGRFYSAYLQVFLGYFFMFFILVYGWDGSGWQRFLYDPTVNNGVLWTPGTHMGLGFITSNVALTLYGMGVILIPALVIPMVRWIRVGAYIDPDVRHQDVPAPISLAIFIGIAIFCVNLGSAGAAAILCWLIGKVTGVGIGIILGLPLFLALAWFVLLRENMPGYRVYRRLFIQEPVK